MSRDSLVPDGTRADRRRGGGRLARCSAVAMLAMLLALLVGAGAAQAAGASIKGTVTAAKGGAPLSGVTVKAFGETESHAVTNAEGKYTIEGLSEGFYEVAVAPTGPYVAFNGPSSFVAEGESKEVNIKLKAAGTLEGTVTSSVTGLGIAGVQVEARGPEFSEGFATTNSEGKYTIEGLVPGQNTVSYYSPSGLYLYESFSLAIEEGANVKNVALREGGKITGVVTDAYTHAGLGKIGVYAYKALGGNEGYAATNANGEYTITGLTGGSYTLSYYWEYSEAEYKAFEKAPRPIPKYITQYYSGQPTSLTANPVTAAENTTTSGINVAMVPTVPYDTALPVVTGTAAVGSLLSCSTGTWTGEAELTPTVGWTLSSPFGYQWLRDGVAIAGATANAYALQAGDLGHGLACEVTASNNAGHVSARSATFAVALPVPVVTSTVSKLTVSKNAITFAISCGKATCSGSVQAVVTVLVKHGKHKKKQKVVIASGTYSVAAGAKGTATLHLTSAGRQRLDQAPHHRLSPKLVISVKGGKAVERTVSLAAGK